MNVPALKEQMRRYALKNKLAVPRVRWTSEVWGVGARQLAWRVSGHYGKATTSQAALWRHFNPETMGQAIARIALHEVGVTEHPAGSNDGVRVRDYQKVTGAYRQPWCGSFNGWCILNAALQLRRKAPQLAPNHAYVPNITDTIRRHLRGWEPVNFQNAQAGDTVTLWQSGHVETVIGRDGDYIDCVGGNTSPVGKNANGGMVAKTRRHRSEVTVIGRAW